MTKAFDLVVIGGGPAGLAAATTAAELGMTVTLIDEQSTPGGQIFRNVENSTRCNSAILGEDYLHGADLVKSFRKSGSGYCSHSQVWTVTPELEIGVVSSRSGIIYGGKRIIIATGSMERAAPFPGWTLPGVMTVGAGQILLKKDGLVPATVPSSNGGIVLAGVGPLLLQLACQYLRAGVAIHTLLDMTPMTNYLRACPYLPAGLGAGEYLRKGMALKRELKKSGIPIVSGVEKLKALGGNRLKSVEYVVSSQRRTLETDLLMVHFGVVPDSYLGASIGIHEVWNEGQQCWCPSADLWGNTNINGIALAGDCAGIGGAHSAELSGRLVALHSAYSLGHIDKKMRDQLAIPLFRERKRDLRVRPFLEKLFKPPVSFLQQISDDTLVCRCEEVTAGRVKEAVSLGCRGPNQVKAFTRAGMGPCQGRQCSSSVSYIVAEECGAGIESVGHFRVRPPVKPITLGTIMPRNVVNP